MNSIQLIIKIYNNTNIFHINTNNNTCLFNFQIEASYNTVNINYEYYK